VAKGSFKETLLLAIPSFFDLVATVLMNIGLLSVTASVYQMMRGAEMLFAALFAVLFLKRHLNKFHYLGILCCAVRTGGRSSYPWFLHVASA
jgi:drug/metabolite transporter (DMT)-like permease